MMGFGSSVGGVLVRQRARRVLVGIGVFCATLSMVVLSACGGNPAHVMTPAPTSPPTMVPGSYPSPSATQYPALLHWNRTQPLTPAQLADWYISQMTIDEEIGQLFIAEFGGPTFTYDDQVVVQQEHVGGLILYNVNLQKADQARLLLSTSQSYAYLPLLMTIDQEGGYVNRLSDIYGPDPSESDIGATNDPNYAYEQGKIDAEHMKALGLNVNLAPDVDVQLVAGPDQVTRTFGSTPEEVIKMGGAFLDGMQDNGVIGTLKHFPGLGSAKTDAHVGLPVINSSREQIENIDLAPYRALIRAGKVHMIMTTDLLMPAIDPVLPAELSPATITGVLRDELGYDGVVITDALYMKGIFKKFDLATAGVMALQAGCDLLLGGAGSYSIGQMIQAIKNALADGALTKARIDQSVRRILLLKMYMGLIPVPGHVAHGAQQSNAATPQAMTTNAMQLTARLPEAA